MGSPSTTSGCSKPILNHCKILPLAGMFHKIPFSTGAFAGWKKPQTEREFNDQPWSPGTSQAPGDGVGSVKSLSFICAGSAETLSSILSLIFPLQHRTAVHFSSALTKIKLGAALRSLCELGLSLGWGDISNSVWRSQTKITGAFTRVCSQSQAQHWWGHGGTREQPGPGPGLAQFVLAEPWGIPETQAHVLSRVQPGLAGNSQ